MQHIAFDSHKHYTLACVQEVTGTVECERRIEHERGAIRRCLAGFDAGSPVAVETIGNWYWIVDEIEEAGKVPHLVHAREAKLMMGSYNKNDRLDARGMNLLQRNGTLPKVWIPPKEIRDLQDLPRTRMVFSRERTQIKNRIHCHPWQVCRARGGCERCHWREEAKAPRGASLTLAASHTIFSREPSLPARHDHRTYQPL